MQHTIGFIGAGHMASAMIAGLCQQHVDPGTLIACATSLDRLLPLKTKLGINTTLDIIAVIEQADILVFAVKPQNFTTLLTPPLLQALAAKKPLIISVMTGLRLQTLQASLGADHHIIRTMPNLAATVQHSITALYASSNTFATQKQQATTLLTTIGNTVWLTQEQQLDVFTAVCGSGPAYFFLFFEALHALLQAQGVNPSHIKQRILAPGLHLDQHQQAGTGTKEDAITIAWQLFMTAFEQAAAQLPVSLPTISALVQATALGSCLLAQTSPLSFAALRQSVTSQRGTTQAALEVLIPTFVDNFSCAAKLATVTMPAAMTTLLTKALTAAYLRAVAIGDEWSHASNSR